jgi:SH3 domain-containing protein
MSSMSCPKCNQIIDADSRFCKYCSSDIKPVSQSLNPLPDKKTNRAKAYLIIAGSLFVIMLVVLIIALMKSRQENTSVQAVVGQQPTVITTNSTPQISPEEERRIREKEEAVRFSKLLMKQDSTLSSLNQKELQSMSTIKGWADKIAFLGSGGAGERESNNAKNFLQDIKSVKNQLLQIRQSLQSEQLKIAFNQTIRSNTIAALERRIEYLKEVEPYLDSLTRDFLNFTTFGSSMSVPRAIVDLKNKLQTYSPQRESYVNQIKEIRTKYEITDEEMQGSRSVANHAVDSPSTNNSIAYSTANNVNVRSSPDLDQSDGNVIGKLMVGERVQVLGTSSNTVTYKGVTSSWSEIQVVNRSLKGWVFSSFLSSNEP